MTSTEDNVLHVMVVDDDETSREALVQAVKAFGFDCTGASDGEEAWGTWKTLPIDIVISDWHMPRCDGLELCRRIRESAVDEGPYTYFILITGLGGPRGFLSGTEAGADDYQTKPVDLDELQARLVSATRVVRLHERLARHTALLRRDSQRAERNARVDPLTHVANRLGLSRDLETAWAKYQRYGHRCAAAMCDVDNFKRYNDRFGHVAGDDALRKIARALATTVRASDSVYRYGGEEFLILLPEQSIDEARQAMERVRSHVAALELSPNGRDALTVSIGVAELGDDWSVDHWIERADRALYEAKERGKNRVSAASAPSKPKVASDEPRWPTGT
jgi:diguanylate cyclase (GGDEF)-like protein